MDCRVVVEAAVPVYDVETEDEAVRIAISKTGGMLNPDLNYVEINMSERKSSGEDSLPAFIAADEALVALELEMTVFNVEREEHASRIARKEIGQRLENIPLKIIEVEQIEETDEESADEGGTREETDEDDAEGDTADGNDQDDHRRSSDGNDEDELIPEFEELVDDES